MKEKEVEHKPRCVQIPADDTFNKSVEARSKSPASKFPIAPMAALTASAKSSEQTRLHPCPFSGTLSITRCIQVLAKADKHWN